MERSPSRHAPWVLACAALAVSVACDRSAGGISAGGTGGTGGGGGGEAIGRHCEDYCDAVAACGEDGGATCVDRCKAERLPGDLVAGCAACLDSVACDVAVVACRRGPACRMAWDLEVHGEGLTDLEGVWLRVMVVEAVPGEAWVDEALDVRVRDGSFRVALPSALPAWDLPFDVVMVADLDGDGVCKPGGRDRQWRIPLGVPGGARAISFEAAVSEPLDCRFWDGVPEGVVVEGAGFDDLEGKWVIGLSAWIGPDFFTTTQSITERIHGGSFRMRLGGFGDVGEDQLETTELVAVWMIDLDGDWRCGEADAGGTIAFEAGWHLQVLEALPAAPGTAPCERLRGVWKDSGGAP